MEHVTFIKERDSTGRLRQTRIKGNVKIYPSDKSGKGTHHLQRIYLVDLMKRMFLPAGYPNSVSPDYLRYQILNALQAFCNSLASLISNRAILQGFGVGDPTASPTKALLMTVLQDVFSRLTTIVSAHVIGPSLYPEAKTYRLLADVLNDTATILDTLSPFFNTLPIPGLRVGSLCLSAIFKSLCGISAGGSKAAITMHFATPLNGKGDVGDLNAKDASKETVLALFGMLLGTVIVPYLTTPWSTYTVLFVLVGLHLAINYFGVRGLVLRSLNRQRLSLVWMAYQRSASFEVPTPSQTSESERLFDSAGMIRDISTGEALGQCSIGSSFSEILRGTVPSSLLDLFHQERYIIWFDHGCLSQEGDAMARPTLTGFKRMHICLKEGYNTTAELKGWVHAVEICRNGCQLAHSNGVDSPDAMYSIQTAYETVKKNFPDFLTKLQSVGWNTADCSLIAGSPTAVLTNITSNTPDLDLEDKKSQ